MNDKRTGLQKRAHHLYCSLLAEALNDSGQDMRKTLKPESEIPWTMENIKNLMFKPVALAMFGTESTTELSTKQISEVYETLNRHTASKLGVSVIWPHNEDKS